ncbi:hypothetical protein D3C78_1197880 [compost metagenome]
MSSTRSLVALKPISDRKVEQEDSAAAMMPTISMVPSQLSMTFIAAQITAFSGLSMDGLSRLIAAPISIRMMYSIIRISPDRQAERITTCSLRAIR